MIETERVEFKAILNDKFEKEIVAFLNSSRGGELYIGMNDKGKPIGIENIDLTAVSYTHLTLPTILLV